MKRGRRKNLFIIGGIAVGVLLVLGIYSYLANSNLVSLSPKLKGLGGKGSQREATISVTHCMELDRAGTYVLQNDVPSHGICFPITADNVVLDGNGHSAIYFKVTTPDGSGGYYTEEGCPISTDGCNLAGVYSSESRTGITIKNLRINGYLNGIVFFNGLSHSEISNNRIENSHLGGTGAGDGIITIEGTSSENIIKYNIISTPEATGVISGIKLDSSNNDLISNNHILLYSSARDQQTGLGSGIQIGSMTRTIISQNTIETHGQMSYGVIVNGGGYVLRESSGNRIEYNTIKTISDLSDGIRLVGLVPPLTPCLANDIVGNNIEVNGGDTYGIYASFVKTIDLRENIIRNFAGSVGSVGSGIRIANPFGPSNAIVKNDIKITGISGSYGIDAVGFGVDSASSSSRVYSEIRENKIDSANNPGSSSIHIVSEDINRVNAGVYMVFDNIIVDNGQLQLDVAMMGVRNGISIALNQQIKKYSIRSDFLQFGPQFLTDHNSITFSAPVNFAGDNLNDAVQIGDNSAYVNSVDYPGLNKQATVSFTNLPLFRNPIVLRDGQLCLSSVCTTLHYYPISEGRFGANFRVIGWSSYSIGESSNNICADSDGGFNPSIKGICTVSSGETSTSGEDSCIVGGPYNGGVGEYHCVNDRCTADNYKCPNGCVNGACVSGVAPRSSGGKVSSGGLKK